MDPEKKSLNFIFPTKYYVIPKSLKLSHWPSKTVITGDSWGPMFERRLLPATPQKNTHVQTSGVLSSTKKNAWWLVNLPPPEEKKQLNKSLLRETNG